MTCSGPYEMFNCFPHIMFYCYQILCFSMFNYLNAYKQFLFNLTVILWNVIFPTQNYCVVYISFTGYQMKA